MTRDEVIFKIGNAIARKEGFYAKFDNPTIAQRNHNPGNIRCWHPEAGYAVYPDDKTGFEKLHHLIGEIIDIEYQGKGLNLLQFFAGVRNSNGEPIIENHKIVYSGYAPSKDNNDPIKYAEQVVVWGGLLDATTPIKDWIA